VEQRIDRDQAGEAEDQRVVFAVGQERLHRQDAVGALAVLHHHRLAPSLRQSLGKHPRHHVHATAGSERRDEPHGALWPGRRGLGVRHVDGCDRREAAQPDPAHEKRKAHEHPPARRIWPASGL
jgi:hypothetical protein